MSQIEQLNLVERMFDKVSKSSTFDKRLPNFYQVIGLVDNKGKPDNDRISEFMDGFTKKYEKLIKDILEYEQGSKDTKKSDAP